MNSKIVGPDLSGVVPCHQHGLLCLEAADTQQIFFFFQKESVPQGNNQRVISNTFPETTQWPYWVIEIISV